MQICEHIKDNGFRCGTPAIRGRHFCYYHSRAHAPSGLGTRRYRAPIPETIESLQLTLLHITEALGSNTITEKRAGKLLYSVQLATNLLKMKALENQNHGPEEPCGADTPVRESPVAAVPTPDAVDTPSSITNHQSPITNPPETRNLKLETEVSPAMAAALAPHPIEPLDEPEPAPAPITRKKFDHLFGQLMTRKEIEKLRPVLGDGDANPAYNRATQRLTDHYNALQALAEAGITEDDPRLQPYVHRTPPAE